MLNHYTFRVSLFAGGVDRVCPYTATVVGTELREDAVRLWAWQYSALPVTVAGGQNLPLQEVIRVEVGDSMLEKQRRCLEMVRPGFTTSGEFMIGGPVGAIITLILTARTE
jgi:hypothetical protein